MPNIFYKSMIKNKLFFIVTFVIGITVQAQNSKIQGKAINKKGKPLENISIILKNTTYGTVTDSMGEFTLSIPLDGKATVIASSVGYKKSEQKIKLIKGKVQNISFVLYQKSENLDEVIVSSQRRHLKSVVLESSSPTKSNLKLLNTPAPIVSIDKRIIEDQAITSMQGAIQNISGITQAGNNYGIGDNLVIRGLGANYTYDGMYGGSGLGNTYNPSRTTTNIEKVEVVKGPVTGLYGIGSAGGVINMIEKKPLDIKKITATAQIGNWNYYRIMADASLPINKKTAFRIVVAKESTDGYRNVEKDVNELHASFKYKLTDNNTFIVSSSYIDDKNQIESVGYPVRIFSRESLADPKDKNITWEDLVNDSNADGDKYIGIQLTEEQRKELAKSIRTTDGIHPFDLGDGNLISPLSKPNKGKEFRIKLRNDWNISKNTKLTQQLLYRKYNSDFTRQTGAYNYVYWNRRGEINANPRAPLVIKGVLYPYAARRQEYRHQESEEKMLQYFADFKNNWKINSLKGQHLISYNFQSFNADSKSWSIYDADGNKKSKSVPYILDIRKPNWGKGTFWDYSPSLRSNYNKKIESYGIALQEVIQLFDDRLTGRFGGAYSKIKQSYIQKGTDRNKNLEQPLADTDDAGFTYNLGLNYQFIKNIAAFINHSKGRTAYSILGSIKSKDNRPDSESESLDAGLRFSFEGKESKLYASAVYFKTARTNLRYSNPLYNDNIKDPEYNVSVPRFFYDNKDETEGFEIDMSLAINKNWSLSTNATYQDAILIRSKEKSSQRKGIPQKFIRSWAEYRLYLPKIETPIRFNIGYQYTSKRTVNSSAFGLPIAYLPENSIWNAAVSFQYKKWDLRVNVNNLLNEKYYSKAMFLGGLPGEKRNYTATLRYIL